MDDDLYARFKAFVDEQPKIGPPTPFPDFLPAPKTYTISSLPATANPVKLANNWIHHKCEDVPLPYRWEIKENTHIFYDWLAHYFPEITWDRPHHSQIIYWRRPHP